MVVTVFLFLLNLLILAAYNRLSKKLSDQTKEFVTNALRSDSLASVSETDGDLDSFIDQLRANSKLRGSDIRLASQYIESIVDSLMTIKVVDSEHFERSISAAS